MVGTRSQTKEKNGAASSQTTTGGENDVQTKDLTQQQLSQYWKKMREVAKLVQQAQDLIAEAEKYKAKRQEYLAKSEHHQKLAQKYKSKADEYFVRAEHVDASNEEGERQTTKRMKLDTHEKYMQEHAMAQNFKLQSEDCLKKAADAEDSLRDLYIAVETLLATRFDFD